MSATVHNEEEVRNTMKKYWSQHSEKGSIEEMMLDDQATEIESQVSLCSSSSPVGTHEPPTLSHIVPESAQDREEVLSLQPALKGKRVLELAAGIGRFTGHLSQRVGPEGSVTAVEFMQSFSDKNEAAHKQLGNTHFICADVTKLEQPEGSYDVIFINWLLMYLGDEEVKAFARNALSWLAPGGHIFFRESCLQQSGSKKRDFNPTNYRDPSQYDAIFDEACTGPYPVGSCFQIVRKQASQTYLARKGNPNQLTWLWQKTELTN